jgi:DNA-binding XRE family transcriptional regulator
MILSTWSRVTVYRISNREERTLEMTRAEMARQLGVSRSYITMIEQGKRTPSKRLQKKLGKSTRECSLPHTIPAAYTQEVRGSSPLLPASPIFLSQIG